MFGKWEIKCSAFRRTKVRRKSPTANFCRPHSIPWKKNKLFNISTFLLHKAGLSPTSYPGARGDGYHPGGTPWWSNRNWPQKSRWMMHTHKGGKDKVKTEWIKHILPEININCICKLSKHHNCLNLWNLIQLLHMNIDWAVLSKKRPFINNCITIFPLIWRDMKIITMYFKQYCDHYSII